MLTGICKETKPRDWLEKVLEGVKFTSSDMINLSLQMCSTEARVWRELASLCLWENQH